MKRIIAALALAFALLVSVAPSAQATCKTDGGDIYHQTNSVLSYMIIDSTWNVAGGTFKLWRGQWSDQVLPACNKDADGWYQPKGYGAYVNSSWFWGSQNYGNWFKITDLDTIKVRFVDCDNTSNC